MIILNLKGGLGNQVFQLLASLKYLNRENCYELYIYSGNVKLFKTSRTYELNPFIQIEKIEINHISKFWGVFLNKFALAVFHKINFLVVNDDFFEKKYTKLSIIDGYFHNVQFFDKNGILLIKESIEGFRLSLKEKFEKNIGIDLGNNNILGIHLRFGDRFSSDQFTIYQNRISNFDFTQYNQVIVFSDQIEICEVILNLIPVNVIFACNYCNNDFEEFILCSLIKEFLVPNSTFSILARLFSDLDSKTYFNKGDFKTHGIHLPKIIIENCIGIEIDF